jgi:hypothetical protein
MDYFFRLARRALNIPGQPLAQPRLPSRYELRGEIARQDTPINPADASAQRPSAAASAALVSSDATPERRAPQQLAATELAAARAGQLALGQPSLPATPSLFSRRTDPTVALPGELSGSAAPAPEQTSASRQPGPIAVALSVPPPPAMLRPPASAIQPRATDQTTGRTAADGLQLDASHPDGAAPNIRVTIGRIDVRAVIAPAPPSRRAPPAAPKPAQGLEDYLRAGKGGSSKP